ncbi:MAG: hypothetical protein Q4D79_07605 [Propionibacteriaceae bacterium]|nr:hypothetical protein [Propionibacteriaceae bacterium]
MKVDVPTLVTGLIVTGFALISGWFASGHWLIAPGKTWFAAVLLAAGAIGLVLSLGRRAPEEKESTQRKQP